LSVFRGGFVRESAEHVAGASLGLLASLVSRSLVVRMGEGRYSLHELVRQYAAQRLAETGEETHVLRKYAEEFLNLAQRANLLAESPAAQAWRRRLETEQGNLRAVLAWAEHHAGLPGAGLLGLRLATALGRFWYLQGLWI